MLPATDSSQALPTKPVRMDTEKRRWWFLAGFSGVACAACIGLMAQRIGAYHEVSPRPLWAFQRVGDTEFRYAERDVRITDDRTRPEAWRVVFRYGEQELPLRVTIPGDPRLPGMAPHEDWLRVLRFTEATGKTEAEFKSLLGSGSDRLVAVTRSVAPGTNPHTRGSVNKKAWVFDFYEFLPAGGFEHQRLKYPTATGLKKPREGELHEGTWQMEAALHLMPQAGGVGPTRNFTQNALVAAGWTLPAAAFTGLGCFVGVFFALAPRRRA